MTSFDSIQKFSEHAARMYLQSAVFIDDKIYDKDGSVSIPPETAVHLPKRKSAIKGSKGPSQNNEQDKSESLENDDPESSSNEAFSTQDLVGSFAKHGIVCAPYQPEANFETDDNSEVFKLCEAADLVILDWDFNEHGLTGTKPKSLIANLIREGNNVAPHHVRLIVVYTTTPSLSSVANAILQDLSLPERNISVEPVSDSQNLSLQAGSSRVVVLGKPTTGRISNESNFTIAEGNLAERVIIEFSLMNKGILPSSALLGMAAVRRNSRRILDKFDRSMDEAFLFHRALIMDSEEAFEQLPELIADEMRAIVEDASIYPGDISSFVENIVDDLFLEEQQWKRGSVSAEERLKGFFLEEVDEQSKHKDFSDLIEKILGAFVLKKAKGKKGDNRDTVSTKEVLTDLLLKGHTGLSKHKDIDELAKIEGKKSFHRIDKKLLQKLMKLVPQPSSNSHERLATLLGIRTQYLFDKCYLTFGTVVLDVASDSYSLCIMPLCDSIRLKQNEEISFPFWRLENMTDQSGHGIVVDIDEQQYKKLMGKGKLRDMFWLANFQPHSNTGVVKAEKEDKKFFFTSGEKKYKWIAQLKPAHAQRIVHQIGLSLSRVGLTEAEWVRLMCDR